MVSLLLFFFMSHRITDLSLFFCSFCSSHSTHGFYSCCKTQHCFCPIRHIPRPACRFVLNGLIVLLLMPRHDKEIGRCKCCEVCEALFFVRSSILSWP